MHSNFGSDQKAEYFLERNTTALGAGATYLTQFYNVSGYSHVVGVLISDQPGTIRAEYSPDGSVTARGDELEYDPAVHYEVNFKLPCMRWPYFRIRYINGVNPQGTFLLDFGVKNYF